MDSLVEAVACVGCGRVLRREKSYDVMVVDDEGAERVGRVCFTCRARVEFEGHWRVERGEQHVTLAPCGRRCCGR